MRTIRRLAIFLFVFVCSSWAMAQAGGAYQRLVIFGDSLSDTGNAFALRGEVETPPYQLIPDAPYARGGMAFTNGKTWVDYLARDLGVPNSARPALRGHGPFSNYATGGARARDAGGLDLSTQVQLALGDGMGGSGTLYVVFIGGNDLRDAVEALRTDPTFATSTQIITDAIQSIADNIVALAGAGAVEIVVANGPNLGIVPAVVYQGPQAQAGALYLSQVYNSALEDTLDTLESQLPLTLHRMDVYGTVTAVAMAPALYGFTNVDTPCVLAGPNMHAACTTPADYLFWDGIHPTQAGHAILAGAALQAISGP